MKNILIILLTLFLLMSFGWSQPDTLIYNSNPDMNGQFFDAILVSRNPDCRAYTMDANNGNYGSHSITDVSNGNADAISNVQIDMVIASSWNASAYDYDNVVLTNDPQLATHCRIISNMIPNHNFGVEVTGPNGDGWIHPIDHSDIEVTYIPVDPIRTDIATDTPRNPPIYDFDGILLNGVGISMDSGFCYNPGVTTGPPPLQSNEACNTSGCGPQNSWFELPAYSLWNPDAEFMAAVFDSYFAHGYEGTYHYHALTHPLQEDTDQTQPPSNGDASPVIGFAPDGFPIYGHWFINTNNQLVKAESGYETYTTNSRTPIETALHGTPPTPWDIANNPDDFECDFGLEMGRYEEDWYFAGTGNLDECNGAYDVNGDYGYYITDKYPFTPPCTFGIREPSFSKQSPTLPQQVAVDYSSGWNMVGLALDVGSTHYQTLFSEAYPGTLFLYDDSYQSETMLIPGTGYLLRLSSGGITNFSGQPINELTQSLIEGWNLISGISTPVDADVFYNSGLVVPGGIYGYDGSYFYAEVIDPGRGYWVRAIESGELTLTSNSLVKQVSFTNIMDEANSISFGNENYSTSLYFGIQIPDDEILSYSLPPKFSQILFDARFTGDMKYVFEYGEIDITNTEKSTKINYNIKVDAGEDMNWVLTSESGKKYILEGSGELIVPSAERFIINRESVIPVTFALHQNFPNPFNPITTLRYDLPSDAFVILSIYDMLGRMVAQLVSDNQQAGFKSVQWDATDSIGKPVSAGVYLYQIQAGEFVQTKKMVLLK